MIRIASAKSFCRDDYTKIENYKEAVNDNTQTWELHHRNEFTFDGKFAHTAKELKEMNMYFKRPANELIFLTPSEHRRMHNMNMTDETRKKISDTLKGHSVSDETRMKMKNNGGHTSYWKGKRMSDEARKKMSDAKKGKAGPMKGKHHSEETRRKISEASKKYQESKRNGNNV